MNASIFHFQRMTLLFAISWADGEIQEEERTQLEEHMNTLGPIDPEDHEKLLSYYKTPVPKSEIDAVFKSWNANPLPQDQAELLINGLRRMACADSIIDDREEAIYEKIRECLH